MSLSSQQKAQRTQKRQWKDPSAEKETKGPQATSQPVAQDEEKKHTTISSQSPRRASEDRGKSLFGAGKKNVFNPFSKMKKDKGSDNASNQNSGIGSGLGMTTQSKPSIAGDSGRNVDLSN